MYELQDDGVLITRIIDSKLYHLFVEAETIKKAKLFIKAYKQVSDEEFIKLCGVDKDECR